MTQPKLCKELYGVHDARTYVEAMASKVCHRPARYRIEIPSLPGVIYRCGVHARWYQTTRGPLTGEQNVVTELPR